MAALLSIPLLREVARFRSLSPGRISRFRQICGFALPGSAQLVLIPAEVITALKPLITSTRSSCRVKA